MSYWTVKAPSAFVVTVVIGLVLAGAWRPSWSQEKVVAISTTASITTAHPYGDSGSQMYSLMCQVYGCLGRFNYQTRQFEGVLARSWGVKDDRTWRFTLRDDLVRHDGAKGPTSRDVIHSWQRVLTDPASLQRFYFAEVEKIVAVDDLTFDVVTKRPMAPLLSYLFDRFAITSADLYQEHGVKADQVAPYGWGPYALAEFTIDQRVVIKKHQGWKNHDAKAPEVAVFRLIREPEQRVTALLNGEVHISRLIPPQLIDRIKSRSDVRVVETGSIEPMFIAMNSKFKPWDDVRVRQAAAHAIDRDLIIKRLLFGLADRLDGPLGPEQICYSGPVDNPITYDPEKAKRLLAEAGYTNGGPAIEFTTANGRYISDRQIAEAVTQMLTRVGFKVTLHAPEFANMWADLRTGRLPMFYMGRGLVLDPSEALSQLFETGVTPRVGYSNKELDSLFVAERQTFDSKERCKILRQVSDTLVREVPAHFMWTHRLVNGVRRDVTWAADASGEVWVADIRM